MYQGMVLRTQSHLRMSPLTYESAAAKVATTMRIAEVVAYADGEDEGDEEDE